MTRIPIPLQNSSLSTPARTLTSGQSALRLQLLKRLVDIAAAFLGLLFILPLFALAAVLIALDSPGGVFYRQPRLGKDGVTFDLFKLRTMYSNADQVLEEGLRINPKLQREWNSYQKLKDDPRVTRAGRLLRRFDLDELPQLWNVLRGEMSLVGPRPILTTQRDLYGQNYTEYIRVLPGITGLWQVSGRNSTTFARRAELDREYIQKWSIWLDTRILFKTIPVVLREWDAY